MLKREIKNAKERNRILFLCALLPILFFNIPGQFGSDTVAMNKSDMTA